MKEDPLHTDEELHRFIDGELDEAARQRLEGRLDRDSALAERVRDYRNVDRTLREAFDDIEPPQRPFRSRPRHRRIAPGLAAAALLLSLSLLTGWFGHALLTDPEGEDLLAGGITLPSEGQEHLKTVFHIDVDEKAVAEQLLDRVETVLTTYADRGVEVEVVANAAGLNLLRADTSVVASRVSAMMNEYDNLVFVACVNAIRRLQEQGVDVQLIDRTHAKETAIDHVVDRLREGWTYVKI